MIAPELRLPLCGMAEANGQRLRQALETYGLFKTATGDQQPATRKKRTKP